MPVILPQDAEAEWLAPDAEPGDLLRLLAPWRGELETREVDDLVNSVREDGPRADRAAASGDALLTGRG